MKQVQRPYWLILTLTLPQAALALIFWRLHGIIGSLLNVGSNAVWLASGLALAVLWLGFTSYAATALFRRRPVHSLTGLAVFALYLPWLYLVLLNIRRIIPWDIPRWMLSWAAPELFIFTFIMPALAYAMILLVATFTPEPGRYKPLRDVLVAVGVPGVWYLLANISLATLHFGPAFSPLFRHLLPILLILSTAAFLFVLARLLYALLREQRGWLQRLILPILLFLPLPGLALNQSLHGLFGDFSHPLFYVLASLTGLALVFPAPKDRRWRLALYAAKSVLLPFTVYFFLVFLPYLPLAIPLIILAGAGFLVLSPLVLGGKHLLTLRDDILTLRSWVGVPLLTGLLLLGIAVLPGSLYLVARQDGVQIQRALDYLYRSEPKPDMALRLSTEGLARALRSMKAKQSGGRGLALSSDGHIPYLTAFYNWVALDSLTLAWDRVDLLERVFFDRPSHSVATSISAAARPPSVTITGLQIDSTPQERGFYRNRIDLELTNGSMNQAEFSTHLDLPAGCYLTGYDLVVEGRRKQGLLVDRRAAVWVYQQVVNERKDPGLLVYSTGNQVNLRVFPFGPKETRHTGLELVHITPVTLTIGGRRVNLGEAGGRAPAERAVREAFFVPAALKKDLPRVRRDPAYHFILDYSAMAKGKTSDYAARVKAFMSARGLTPRHVTVTAANYNLTTLKPVGDWRNILAHVPTGGGFHLDRAVKAFLYQHYQSGSREYPVIVALTDQPSHWRLYDDYAAWRPAFPESDAYYRLAEDGDLYRLSLLNGDAEGEGARTAEPSLATVLAWPARGRVRAYLADDGRDDLVLTGEAFTVPGAADQTHTAWENGLSLAALSTGLAMNPAGYHRRELSIIQLSQDRGVMVRETSFIVLENEAQEAALRAKQRQIMATGKVADLGPSQEPGENDPEMAEPSLLVLAALAALIVLIRRLRGRAEARRLVDV